MPALGMTMVRQKTWIGGNIMESTNDIMDLEERLFNDNPQLRDRLRFSHRDDWETFILDEY